MRCMYVFLNVEIQEIMRLGVLQQDSEAYISSSKLLFKMVEAVHFHVFHPWPSMRFWNTQQKKHTPVFLPLLFPAPQLPFMLRGH